MRIKKNFKNGGRFKGKKNYKKNSNSTKKPTERRHKNWKFIQRSKEAEDSQRRQKIVEDKYRKQVNENESSMSEDEAVEENPFDKLLSTLQTNDDKFKVIESSSDDEEPEDSENDELTEEEISEDEEGSEEEGVDEDGDEDEDDSAKGEATEDEEDIIEEAELDDEIEAQEHSNKFTTLDPFTTHLENQLGDDLLESVRATPPNVKKQIVEWPKMGKLQFEIPKSKTENDISDSASEAKKRKLLPDDEVFASEGIVPERTQIKKFSATESFIKSQLQSNLKDANKKYLQDENADGSLKPLQCELFSIVNNYQDLFYPHRSFENSEEIRFIYCLHALNHILKTRSKVLHHNAKLTVASGKNKDMAIVPDLYRDQGLVRPKILIMLPFRESAFKVVNVLISLLFGNDSDTAKTNGSVINYKRFLEEYTGDTLHFPKTNPKPEDYEKTFAGNTDDNFRIGISLTKKCMKLYTEFYSSDILVASPLGLRMVVGAPGDADRDYDFLSSIELLVLDQVELFVAQNWDHFLHVVDHLHLQPQSARNTDFSRVRPWCINGWSRFYRQTLLFTSHDLPEFRSLYNSKCCNYRGKVRTVNPVIGGTIRHVAVQIPQVFHKIDVTSVQSSFDTRFQYFINEILPQYKSPSMAHCMVYVPSYFDYVRLRNYFKSESMNFVQICEYTKDAKIARARDMFFHSGAHFLLYSERAHFFRRTRIKGIRHLIIYQPPYWPHFYPEMINLMQDANQNPRDGLESSMTVTVLYTKYDMLQTSAIMGTERAAKMLQSGKPTHMFTTGEI